MSSTVEEDGFLIGFFRGGGSGDRCFVGWRGDVELGDWPVVGR